MAGLAVRVLRRELKGWCGWRAWRQQRSRRRRRQCRSDRFRRGGRQPDDFGSDTSQAGGRVIRGADEFVSYVRHALGKPSQPTVHQVHAPEITLTSPTTATGIWALEDVVRLGPGVNLNGRGHYHETYEKLDGSWLIKSSTLTRLREDIFNPIFSVRISPRLRDTAALLARRLGR
ncbi:nuclear transport factor 2 family protein [Mycobacterium kansasii]|uniref:nuclear transport factor 2 family protein n=1 Tax=Mycobacterium kansasii TaxID=1768 RepID=UPI003B97EF7C